MSKTQILNGHGGWLQMYKTFVVPKGITVHFFSAHGSVAYDKETINKIIMEYGKPANRQMFLKKLRPHIKESVGENSHCYNYKLSPPNGVTKFKGNVVKEFRESRMLADLVMDAAKKGIVTDVVFYACRSLSSRKIQPLYGDLTASQTHRVQARVGISQNWATALEEALLSGFK